MRRDRSDEEFELWEIVCIAAEAISILTFFGVLFGILIKVAL